MQWWLTEVGRAEQEERNNGEQELKLCAAHLYRYAIEDDAS